MTPSLHPDCPDLARLAPNRTEAVLRAQAARVSHERAELADAWRSKISRRRVLAGAGLAGLAGMGAPLVTTRASFAAQPGGGTMIVVFLRGGLDGLSVVVPADDPHLLAARPKIAVRAGSLLPLVREWGLHPELAPLHEYWKRGQFSAVPAVSTPDLSRSHFQAQDCLERGGAAAGATEGWLDRVLDVIDPGTSFRAIGQGSNVPRSLAGDQPSLSINDVAGFKLGGWEAVHEKTKQAMRTLYSGFDHPLNAEVANLLSALDTAAGLNATDYTPAATYPDHNFAKGLTQLAQLIKADVGLRIAAIDVDGWDHHTNIGNVDGGDMKTMLTWFGQSLAAFGADLGSRLNDVTIVTMTEFGRRVEQNANNGTDHGHGATVLLLGGGLAGGDIHGNWPGIAPEARDQGDVAGANDYRDVLSAVLTARLGVSPASLATVFPDHQVTPMTLMA